MKILYILSFVIMNLVGNAQTNTEWTIGFNDILLLKANASNNEPVAEVKASCILSNAGSNFSIDFIQPGADKNWKRTFFINDIEDHTFHTIVLHAPAGKVHFKASVLLKQAKTKQPVFIYSDLTPKDEKKAALVRVRRILLCKIVWK